MPFSVRRVSYGYNYMYVLDIEYKLLLKKQLTEYFIRIVNSNTKTNALRGSFLGKIGKKGEDVINA